MFYRAPVERLSAQKHFELASSPHVKILVGPGEKQYSLPGDLIAYYSPYFASCFKNNWKEAYERVLRLTQEDLEFFDVLCDYFHRGDAKYVPACNLDNEGEWQAALQKCFAFIRFTDMYDATEAATAVKGYIWFVLSSRRFDDCVVAVGAEEMQFCIETSP